jgi:argininosuccinate lyase
MQERLATPPSPEVVQHLYRPRLEKQRDTLFKPMLAANFAHVVMLFRQGIITRQIATQLLEGLKSLAVEGPDTVNWDPNLEDMYYNLEGWLITKIGIEAAGRLHTGRSRNDLYANLSRMYVRERLIVAGLQLTSLREAILTLAEENVETIITGYTHLQPAQPITLGHYLSAVAAALQREHVRLTAAYAATNQSSLGACALAGTSFPIDRALVADLLGFDGVVDNTLDAVASRDYFGDTLFALAMAGTVLSRFATDLYQWCSFEYAYIELSDATAGTSSIMPQKKNPFVLERVRSKVAHLDAALLSALACWKGVAFTHNQEIAGESEHMIDDAFDQFGAASEMMRGVVKGLKVNATKMRQALDQNLAIVTDFADALVQEGGLPFRVAHQVLGLAVRQTLEHPGSRLDGNAVLSVLKDKGICTSLSSDRLNILALPETAVKRRSHLGGPAPDEVRRQLTQHQGHLAANCQEWVDKRTHLSEAEKRLDSALEAVIYGQR